MAPTSSCTGNSVNKVAGMIIGTIVLQICLQSAIAALTRDRVTDERDQLIELRLPGGLPHAGFIDGLWSRYAVVSHDIRQSPPR